MGLTVSKRPAIITEAMIRTFYISMLGSNVRNEMCLLGSLNEMGHQLNIESSCQQNQTSYMCSTDSHIHQQNSIIAHWSVFRVIVQGYLECLGINGQN